MDPVLQLTFNTPAGIISFLIGFVIPLVTALVAKPRWSRATKGIITLVLSAITSFLSQWLQSLNSHDPFNWKAVALTGIVTLFIAIGTYFGWWKGSPIQVNLHNSGNT